MSLCRYSLPPPEAFYSLNQQEGTPRSPSYQAPVKTENERDKEKRRGSSKSNFLKQAEQNQLLAEETEAEDIPHARALGIMHQMTELFRYATEIFEDVHKEATHTNQRLSNALTRLDAVSKHVTAEHPSSPIQETTEQLKSSLNVQTNNEDGFYGLFDSSTRPSWLKTKYNRLKDDTPNFDDLDQYFSEHNRPIRNRFSNPDFFYDKWLRHQASNLKTIRVSMAQYKKEVRRSVRQIRRKKMMQPINAPIPIRLDSESDTSCIARFKKIRIVNPAIGKDGQSSLLEKASSKLPELEGFRDSRLKKQAMFEESKERRDSSRTEDDDSQSQSTTGNEEYGDIYYDDDEEEESMETRSHRKSRSQSTYIGETVGGNAQTEKAQSLSESRGLASELLNQRAHRGIFGSIRVGKPLKKQHKFETPRALSDEKYQTERDTTGSIVPGILAAVHQGGKLAKPDVCRSKMLTGSELHPANITNPVGVVGEGIVAAILARQEELRDEINADSD